MAVEWRKKDEAERLQCTALAAFKKAEAARWAEEEEEALSFARLDVMETFVQSIPEESTMDIPENQPGDENNGDDSEPQAQTESDIQVDNTLSPPTDFPIKKPQHSPLNTYDNSHPLAFFQILLAMVAYLHAKHHIPF